MKDIFQFHLELEKKVGRKIQRRLVFQLAESGKSKDQIEKIVREKAKKHKGKID